MQAQIRAIETVYKGFRFRSRLEARWAVFFDGIGLRWEYEREGYEIDGERYLPDFWIPDRGMHVEVKPGPAPTAPRPRVYMAGRMGEVLKRERRACYRPFDIYDIDLSEARTIRPVARQINGCGILYTGPFMTGYGNHCAVHGDTDDFAGNEDLCLARALDGIGQADVVFAWLEDYEAFGTLAEIGYAHGLGKRIVVGLGGEIGERAQPTGHGLDTVTIAAGHRTNPLWFACRMAEEVLAGDRDAVLGEFADWLGGEWPVPREQRLIDALAQQGGDRACVVYGDPVEALIDDSNGLYLPHCVKAAAESDMRQWSHKVTGAARVARQARFEYGQSGAAA